MKVTQKHKLRQPHSLKKQQIKTVSSVCSRGNSLFSPAPSLQYHIKQNKYTKKDTKVL